ncbi:MAG: tRNA uracil 4-sulfurtransferase ThiI [Acidaminobacteraceae bacterium]
MFRTLIVRYGEIALKGDNRSYFEKRLVKNMKAVLKGIDCKITKEHGRIFVEFEPEDYDDILEKVIKVFGIVSVSPATRIENDLEIIKETALTQAREIIQEEDFKTFKVESRRANKSFEFKSPEISKIVGGTINQNVEGISVDVHKPDFIVHVEVRNFTYIYSKVIKAYGGMPYGTSGKAMLLLSGGIDSPVAGWMMAKRGVEIEAIHYHSFPFTSDRAKEKVMDLAKILADYFGRIRVHSVNLLEIQKAINENCPSEEMTILSRRFMMEIAEKVAMERKCKALITGENIAQVASQTIEGLNVTNDAVSMPVFRPLIAFDKVDIIKVAEKIGTFETSILPFEDCCTVFLPPKVVTKPRVNKIVESQSKLDIEGLINKAIEEMEVTIFNAEEL